MNNQKTRIKSVSKAIQILDLLGKNPGGLSVKEICIELQLNLSTTYHLVNTLLDHGYISKSKDDIFMLGYQIPFLHNAFLQSMAPHSILNMHLQELSNITQETAYLGKEINNEIVIVGIIECPQAIKVKALYIGYKDYAYARALPRSIMAFWPDNMVKEYFKEKNFEKRTKYTPSNLEELMAKLRETKQRGYCVEEQEFSEGICCIAAPIFDASKKSVAAYSITMPYDRYVYRKEEYIEKVCMVGKKASQHLGYYESF